MALPAPGRRPCPWAPLRRMQVGLAAVGGFVLVASFLGGRLAERRFGDPARQIAAGPDEVDLRGRIMEFSVPLQPGDAERHGKAKDGETEPRMLKMSIPMPPPMNVVPPGRGKHTLRDAQLLKGALSSHSESMRTRFIRYINNVGCFKLAPNDAARQDLGNNVTFMDMNCMKAVGATAQTPCASGLPFFRNSLQQGNAKHTCMIFCMSKGLDVFGVLSANGKMNPDWKLECRCGASARNKAVWGDNPNAAKMINRADKVQWRDPECRMFVWEYTGKMPGDAVPYQFYAKDAEVQGYIDSIIAGESYFGYEEDTAGGKHTVQIHISMDGTVLHVEHAHTRRLQEGPAMPPGTCEDLAQTNIFYGEVHLTCQHIQKFCEADGDIGELTRDACPVTCSVCQKGSWRKCYPDQCSVGRPWTTKTSSGMVYIPFYFTANVDEKRKFAFRTIASDLQRMTCIRFSEQSDGPTPRLRVQNLHPKTCHATVGFRGTEREAVFNMGLCDSIRHDGAILHEMGHIIGMDLQMMRPDAARTVQTPDGPHGPWLQIFWQNIDPAWYNHYKPEARAYIGSGDQGPNKFGPDPWAGYDPYDYDSIMHYGPTSTLGKPAFKAINFYGPIGQRVGFSNADLQQIADMYQCKLPEEPEDIPSYNDYDTHNDGLPNAAPVPTQKKSRPCEDVPPPDWHCDGKPCTCESMKSFCLNSIYSSDLQIYCRKTCGVCNGGDGCGDVPPNGWTCNDGPCTCDLLAGYCHDKYYGAGVSSSCRATCGLC